MQDAFLSSGSAGTGCVIDDPVAYLFGVAMNGFRMRASSQSGGSPDRASRQPT